jgi:hypothetical protein
MDSHLNVVFVAIFVAALAFVFVGMLGFQLLGHRFGVRRAARQPSAGCDGTSAIEASLFALLGLLVAFTMSAAQDRLDARRRLAVDEANAIGTAYLRLDLLPDTARPPVRDEVREYVEARIAFYDNLFDLGTAQAQHRRSLQLQQQIWRDVLLAASRTEDTAARMLLVPAVNQMIDLTTARDFALRTHVPLAILNLLVLLAFACAFFAGVGMAKNRRVSRLHVLAFASIMAVTAYVILNVEFPRAGFVRLGAVDALLRDVRDSMGR